MQTYACSNCNAPITPDADVCANCGSDLDWSSMAIPESPPATWRQRSGFRTLVLLSLGGIGLFSLLLVILSMVQSRPQRSPSPTSAVAAESPSPSPTFAPEALVPAATPIPANTPLPPSSNPSPTAVPPTSPPPSPTPTPTPPGLNGEFIAYSALDAGGAISILRLWDVAANRPGPDMATNAGQADLRPGGGAVFRSTDPARPGLFVVEHPGAAPRQITSEPGDSHPRWSPDGARIVFESTTRAADDVPRLYVLDMTGAELQELGRGQGPAWSPSGAQIVFQTCDVDGRHCGLWQRGLGSAGAKQITAVASDSAPVWSPDGRQIAFMSQNRSPSWDIFVADAVAGNVNVFALENGDDVLAAWSPDGSAIAFMSNRGGAWAVYRWSLADLAIVKLFDIDKPLADWQQAGLDWVK